MCDLLGADAQHWRLLARRVAPYPTEAGGSKPFASPLRCGVSLTHPDLFWTRQSFHLQATGEGLMAGGNMAMGK